ncbi:MAG: nitrile hydratase subunit beta [Actinomycetota bacterium]|nr:nitrile hydratase subunit beta [Actinomycetota bacterium]
MDGIHDMGGTQSWGTVRIDPSEPVFHERWEAKAFAFGALSARLSGQNLDAMRHAIDRQHPLDYLGDGYYGRWLAAVETMLMDSGILAPGAVEARARRLRGEDVEEPEQPEPHKPDYEPTAGGSLRVDCDRAPRFGGGDRVRAKMLANPGHTRLVHYIRGHEGTIVALQPPQVLPDTHAHFVAENAQPVYAVAFEAAELWGPDHEPFTLTIDCYEDYLEPA